ncbi:lysylphosphatidylglycerol synthase transmembrane domain-containing protein [Tropicimonas aquimaris]|uniref:YbhN family protein n=1 Tax=Tropicimonas aquimaris TaxID=914152 RepID=A0ABW3ITJ3_9RHOB
MSPDAQKPARKGFARKAVKLFATLALLLPLGFLVDWQEVFQLLPQMDPIWIFAAAMSVVGTRTAITWRWWQILRAIGFRTKLLPLGVVVSAGMGLGALIPTSLGPDIARGILLRTRATSAGETTNALVVSSLAIDRYAATIATLIVAAFGAVAIGNWAVAMGMAAAVAAVAFVTALMMVSADTVIRTLTPGPLKRARSKLAAVVDYLRHPGMLVHGLVPAVLISTLVTLFRVAVFVSLYNAFGYSVPISLAIFAISVMLIALMVPVTLGNFGIREWLLVIGFQSASIPADVSVAVGLVSFAIQTLISLPAITFLMLRKSRRPATITSGEA